jgi:hypothetical protein
MVNPQTSAVDNMLRLQGLKSARKKAILPGFLDDTYEPEVEQARPPPPATETMPKNLPEPDLGGELNSQSYDVRANASQPAQEAQQENEGVFQKLGRTLAGYFKKSNDTTPNQQQQTNNIPYATKLSDYLNIPEPQTAGVSNQIPGEMAQKYATQLSHYFNPPAPESPLLHNELPPELAEQQVALPYATKLSDYIGPQAESLNQTLASLSPTHAPQKFKNYPEPLLRQMGTSPEEQKQIQTADDEAKKAQLYQSVEDAMQHPFMHQAYGSANIVAHDPKLKQDFREIVGQDFTDQDNETVSAYEEAMKGVEESLQGIQTQLSEQAAQIQQRILDNQATDADKYYIGMALLMPLLVGGFFGKEAAIGALGGAAEGLGNVYKRRGEELREDEQTLLDISKQQSSNQEKLANMKVEWAKLRPALEKAHPENKRAHLEGMHEVFMVDPETGKESYNGLEVKPGLVALPQLVMTKENAADMRALANEFNKDRNNLEKLNRATADIIQLASQVSEKGIGEQFWTNFVLSKDPSPDHSLLAKFGEEVELNGRKVNAAVMLASEIQNLVDAYRRTNAIRGLGPQVMSHINQLIASPYGSFQSPKDTIDQVLTLRELSREYFTDEVRNSGFIPEYMTKKFIDEDKKIKDLLNTKERNKRVSDIESQLHG